MISLRLLILLSKHTPRIKNTFYVTNTVIEGGYFENNPKKGYQLVLVRKLLLFFYEYFCMSNQLELYIYLFYLCA